MKNSRTFSPHDGNFRSNKMTNLKRLNQAVEQKMVKMERDGSNLRSGSPLRKDLASRLLHMGRA